MAEAFLFFVVLMVSVLIVNLFSKSLPKGLDGGMRNKLILIVVIAIILRLLIVAFWHLKVGHSFYVYGDWSTRDSGYYDWAGRHLAQYFQKGILLKREFFHLYGESLGFPYYVGLIYALFGHHQIMVSIFNTLASIILALLMFHIAWTIFNDRKIALWVLIFNLFYPHYVSQSYYLLKDVLLILLLVIFSWLIIRIQENRASLINYVEISMVLTAVYFIRSHLVIILIGLGGLHLIVSLGFKERKVIKTLLFMLICLSLTAGFGTLSPRGRTVFEKIEDFYIGQGGYRGEATPTYLEGATGPKDIGQRMVRHPASALKDFARSLVFIYWGPTYFYQRSGANLFYAYGRFVFWENLGAIMRIFLMPMVIFGFFYCLRKKKVETFLFYSFSAFWTLVMMLSGSGERWSMDLMPFTFMFGAIGIVNFDKIKPFYVLYILAVNILIATNITLYDNLIITMPLAILTLLSILWGLLRYRYVVSK